MVKLRRLNSVSRLYWFMLRAFNHSSQYSIDGSLACAWIFQISICESVQLCVHCIWVLSGFKSSEVASFLWFIGFLNLCKHLSGQYDNNTTSKFMWF